MMARLLLSACLNAAICDVSNFSEMSRIFWSSRSTSCRRNDDFVKTISSFSVYLFNSIVVRVDKTEKQQRWLK